MREFFLIFAAGIISALLGAAFGWALARLAPEFILWLISPQFPLLSDDPQTASILERIAAALGAVVGLFTGAGAMAFALLVSAIQAWTTSRRV